MLEHLREHFEIKPKSYQIIPSHPNEGPEKQYVRRSGKMNLTPIDHAGGKRWEALLQEYFDKNGSILFDPTFKLIPLRKYKKREI